jgi:hypothetical protein
LLKCTKKMWRAYKLMVTTPHKFVGLHFVCATSQQFLHTKKVLGQFWGRLCTRK